MEVDDEKVLALWKRFRGVSIEHYIKLYGSVNIAFDDYSGESQVIPAAMDEVEDLLKTKGISEESDGAWIVDLEKHGGDREGSSSVTEMAAEHTT